MSDQSVIDRLDIRQGARFYTWVVRDPPLARAGIVRSSANLHLILLADAGVERQLLAIRPWSARCGSAACWSRPPLRTASAGAVR